jgi:hypothetical protein
VAGVVDVEAGLPLVVEAGGGAVTGTVMAVVSPGGTSLKKPISVQVGPAPMPTSTTALPPAARLRRGGRSPGPGGRRVSAVARGWPAVP